MLFMPKPRQSNIKIKILSSKEGSEDFISRFLMLSMPLKSLLSHLYSLLAGIYIRVSMQIALKALTQNLYYILISLRYF